MLCGFEFAVDEVQPVREAAQADGTVRCPQALAAKGAQVAAQARQAPGIEAEDHQVASRAEYALHFPQARVRVLRELEGMDGHKHVDAVAFERQLVAVAAQGNVRMTAIAGKELVIDAAAGNEIALRQRAKLKNVVTEGEIENRLQAGANTVAQIVSPVLRVPGFQRLANVARLRARFGSHPRESSQSGAAAQSKTRCADGPSADKETNNAMR